MEEKVKVKRQQQQPRAKAPGEEDQEFKSEKGGLYLLLTYYCALTVCDTLPLLPTTYYLLPLPHYLTTAVT